jgi:protein-tyrosine phosphatase
VIDLHCHVLPGIDDGPDTIEDSLALAGAAASAGTRVMVATPHVSWEYQNDAATITKLARELNARLAQDGVALEVLVGAEIAMTRAADIEAAQLAHLTLGGGGCLLIEPPFAPTVTGIEMLIYRLQSTGYRVVLAHPERCAAFQRDRSVLDALGRSGVLMSITAGSLVGRFGREVRRFASQLVTDEMVHTVSSDAHDTVRRPPTLAADIEQAGFAALAEWWTRAVPEALLRGAEIPQRPPVHARPKRTGWRALSRSNRG